MCIRDSSMCDGDPNAIVMVTQRLGGSSIYNPNPIGVYYTCLLYTSDAADERSSVDLGGRRIIQKKKKRQHRVSGHILIRGNNTIETY